MVYSNKYKLHARVDISRSKSAQNSNKCLHITKRPSSAGVKIKEKIHITAKLTRCDGVLVNVDLTCRKSVRFVISSLAGHLHEQFNSQVQALPSCPKTCIMTRILLSRFRSTLQVLAFI